MTTFRELSRRRTDAGGSSARNRLPLGLATASSHDIDPSPDECDDDDWEGWGCEDGGANDIPWDDDWEPPSEADYEGLVRELGPQSPDELD